MPPDATQETEAQGITEQQAVDAMLERWGAKGKEAPESADEAPADDEVEQPQGDAQAEEEAVEPEADDGETELDFAGEKFKFPKTHAETALRFQAKAKELEAGATRRFQEAADLRKATETTTQTSQNILRVAHAQAKLLSDHEMVTRRLEVLEGININEVPEGSLSRLSLEHSQLQAAKTRIEGQFNQNLQSMQDEDKKAFQAKREYLEKTVSTRIKGWGPEHWKKLESYATGKGVPADNLQGITEPWMVEILDDAAYGHAMRQAKPQQLKRVETTSKTLKPGAAGNPKSAANLKIANATARFQKSGSLDDGASLLLAKLQAKGGRRP